MDKTSTRKQRYGFFSRLARLFQRGGSGRTAIPAIVDREIETAETLTRFRDLARDAIRDAARDVLRDELRAIIREEIERLPGVQNEVFKNEHPLNTPTEPQNEAKKGVNDMVGANPTLYEHLKPLARATLYAQQNPGASVREIARETGVSVGTAQKAKREADQK